MHMALEFLEHLVSEWGIMPHARKGRECLQRTGCTVALPEVLQQSHVLPDGTYVRAKFDLLGREDDQVTREAKKIWLEAGVPAARARALADVKEDFDRKKLRTPTDVWKYLDDDTDGEEEFGDAAFDVQDGSDDEGFVEADAEDMEEGDGGDAVGLAPGSETKPAGKSKGWGSVRADLFPRDVRSLVNRNSFSSIFIQLCCIIACLHSAN